MARPPKLILSSTDKATAEWLNSQKPRTRKSYASCWRDFLEYVGKTGDEILADRKADIEHRWEKTVLSFKAHLIDKGRAPRTAVTESMTVRGFFAFHYVELQYRKQDRRKLGMGGRTTEDYRFTRDEMTKMSEQGDLIEKYVLLTGKSFGLRAGDFIRLRRGDLEPYLTREVPICIGPYNTDKEGVVAWPFIDTDALPVIRAMIDRMNSEGRTDPKERLLKFRKDTQLSRVLRRLAVKGSIQFGNRRVRFHCLRKFLCDHLASFMSESKWKMIVGKTIDEKAYVSPDSLREDYIRAMKETAIAGNVVETDIEKKIKRAILVEKAKELGWTEKEIQDAFTRFDLDQFETWVKASKSKNTAECEDGEHCQRIVAESELAELLAHHWRIVATLPSGKVVIDNERL